MINFNQFINEGKGEDLAKDLVSRARRKMKNLSDNEVLDFRKWIAQSFDLKIDESIINESKDHDFDSIKAGDKIQWAGKTSIVKKSEDGIIHISGKDKDIKVNKSMWKQSGGRLIEKSNKDDEK